MKLNPRSGDSEHVSSEYHRQLNSYALAATAAGVSLLAMAQPAEARIIYKSTHQVIGDRHSYRLDLNGDGKTDVTIENLYHNGTNGEGTSWHSQALSAKMAGRNAVVYNTFGAAALKSGTRVGPKSPFHEGAKVMAGLTSRGTSWSPFGSWLNVKNRYLGLRFKISGEPHYGWARLNVNVQFPLSITATLTGYAYETIPKKPIIAGKTHGNDTGTLGKLSLGASGR